MSEKCSCAQCRAAGLVNTEVYRCCDGGHPWYCDLHDRWQDCTEECAVCRVVKAGNALLG